MGCFRCYNNHHVKFWNDHDKLPSSPPCPVAETTIHFLYPPLIAIARLIRAGRRAGPRRCRNPLRRHDLLSVPHSVLLDHRPEARIVSGAQVQPAKRKGHPVAIRQVVGVGLLPEDPLRFRDSKRYRERLQQAQKATGEKDALVSVTGTLFNRPIVVCAFEFGFMGGSMGSVVGEKFARAAQRSERLKAPLVCFSATGGARMQEGIYSLMQLAKTSSVLARLHEERLPFISILTDPTTGGVTASFASSASIMRSCGSRRWITTRA